MENNPIESKEENMAPSDAGILAVDQQSAPNATPIAGGNVLPPKKSLGLLAEVALRMPYQNLKSEPEDEEMEHQSLALQEKSSASSTITTPPSSSSASVSSSPSAKSSSKETKTFSRSYTLKQVKKFQEKRLLKTFAEYKRDIKTKRSSYLCQMLPAECQQKFDGVGADQKEMVEKIKEHLREHLSNLERDRPQIRLSSCRKVKKMAEQIHTVATPMKVEVKMESNDPVHSHQEPSDLVTVPCLQPNMNSNNPMTDEKTSFKTLTAPMIQLLNPQQQQQASVVNPVEDGSQTVEVISTTADQSIDPLTTVDPALQAKLRSLALVYIDDIRKKSSSAAKSVVVNGGISVIYQCKICPDKQFTSTNGLIFHYKKHAGLKPYVCETCSATFTRQHSLNYHMLIHQNKSRFVCSECSRHFRHPSHFKEHMRRHTGETPFQCADCLIKFKTRNTYKRHLQTKHSKILTSKGIIELPKNVPYQSVPKNSTASIMVSSKGGTAGQPTTVPIQPSTSAVVVRKPRRKYGLPYLHKNIETITKYEQHQNLLQTPPASTLITNVAVPGMTSNNAASGTVGDPLAATTAATAQTAPGTNITIVNFPQLPTVHILDNGGGNIIQQHRDHQTLSRKTNQTATLLNYNNQNRNLAQVGSQPQGITLVSVGSYPHHQFQAMGEPIDHQRITLDGGRTVLTPIQIPSGTGSQLAQQLMSGGGTRVGHPIAPTTTTIDGRNITQLTSAVPLVTGGTGSPTTLYLRGPHGLNPINLQLMTSSAAGTTTTNTTVSTVVTAPPNDNFMRLLEAIEMTEV